LLSWRIAAVNVADLFGRENALELTNFACIDRAFIHRRRPLPRAPGSVYYVLIISRHVHHIRTAALHSNYRATGCSYPLLVFYANPSIGSNQHASLVHTRIAVVERSLEA